MSDDQKVKKNYQGEIKVKESNDDRDHNDGELVEGAALESDPGAGPRTPQCEISWGDSGLVLTCSSLEGASEAVEWLRRSLKLEINPLFDESDSPAVDEEDESEDSDG